MKFLAAVFGAFLVNEALGCVACGDASHKVEFDIEDRKFRRPIKRDDDDRKPRQVDDGCGKVYLADYNVKFGKKHSEKDEKNKYVIIGETVKVPKDDDDDCHDWHHKAEKKQHRPWQHKADWDRPKDRDHKKWLRRDDDKIEWITVKEQPILGATEDSKSD